ASFVARGATAAESNPVGLGNSWRSSSAQHRPSRLACWGVRAGRGPRLRLWHDETSHAAPQGLELRTVEARTTGEPVSAAGGILIVTHNVQVVCAVDPDVLTPKLRDGRHDADIVAPRRYAPTISLEERPQITTNHRQPARL